MLKVILVPQGPVQVKQPFLIAGTASAGCAGRNLKLTIDNRHSTNGPAIGLDGTWQLSFLFHQVGNRTMKFSVEDESVELTVQVVAVVAPPPGTSQVRFTIAPQTTQTGQITTFAGEADGYANGTQLLLRADQRYELGRPQVQGGRWQAPVVFGQAGSHIVEVIGSGQDRAQTTIEVTAAPPRPARPPRLRFTSIPGQIRVEEMVAIAGEADGYPEDAQLVLRVDRQFELARPRVKAGKWQAPVLFHKLGNRVIEIIGSEQDQTEVTVNVQPGELEITPRSAWLNQPTPPELPNLQPKRITLHHTALSSSPPIDATPAQEAERMRFIWRSHVNGNRWSDIGYHYIIMPSGRIYEARAETKRGAHDLTNDGIGIAFDGIFTSVAISQPQFQSAVMLCAKLCQRYGLNNPVTPIPTPTADYGTRNLPLIIGHRDCRVATECPGSEGGKTVRLEEIRQAVKTRLSF